MYLKNVNGPRPPAPAMGAKFGGVRPVDGIARPRSPDGGAGGWAGVISRGGGVEGGQGPGLWTGRPINMPGAGVPHLRPVDGTSSPTSPITGEWRGWQGVGSSGLAADGGQGNIGPFGGSPINMPEGGPGQGWQNTVSGPANPGATLPPGVPGGPYLRPVPPQNPAFGWGNGVAGMPAAQRRRPWPFRNINGGNQNFLSNWGTGGYGGMPANHGPPPQAYYQPPAQAYYPLPGNPEQFQGNGHLPTNYLAQLGWPRA